MEAAIRNRYRDAILDQARMRYAIAPDRIRMLDGFESFMYEFDRDDGQFILRIGHSLRRNVNLIQGEVDWINYLAAGGAGVARAVLSAQGRLVEEIADGQGGHFLATAFVRAPGGPAWQEGRWTPELFPHYGRLIGRLHRLSKYYRVADERWRRPHWDDPRMLDTEKWLIRVDTVALDRYRHLMSLLRTLPVDRDSYGMVHQDAHANNFFVEDDGQITLFDFDDCVYGWYAYDLAMVLFYAVTNEEKPEAFGRHFLAHFLPGYRQENQLDPAWLEWIPHFLKLREIDLYAVIHRTYDGDALMDSWSARFMAGRQERIAHDRPYLDMDFKELRDLWG